MVTSNYNCFSIIQIHSFSDRVWGLQPCTATRVVVYLPTRYNWDFLVMS